MKSIMKNFLAKVFPHLFILFVLLLISGLGYADQPKFSSDAVNNHTDLSIAYLSEIFGTVGGVLQGNSGQMLGMLFYKFNIGVLVVAGLWLAFSVITIVLRGSMEGSFMGANKNTAVVFLRIGLGVGMMMPSATTGYTLFQVITMKVVIQSVALADDAWSYGLEYVRNGGTLWRSPDEAGGSDLSGNKGGQSSLKTDAAKQLFGPIQTVFSNEVCMVTSAALNRLQSSSSSSNNTNGDSTDNLKEGIYLTSMPAPEYDIIRPHAPPGADENYSFQFPGIGDDLEQIRTGAVTGSCGSVYWSSISGSNCTYDSDHGEKINACHFAENAVRQVAYALLPAARHYVCTQPLGASLPECNGAIFADIHAANTEMFFSSLLAYVNGVTPLAHQETDRKATHAKQFISTAEKEGWIQAGRFYWDLSQIQAAYGVVSNLGSYAVKKVNPPTDTWLNNHPKVNEVYAVSKTSSDAYRDGALKKLRRFNDASGHGGSDANGWEQNLGAGITFLPFKIILGPVADDFKGLMNNFSTPADSGTVIGGGIGWDPIVFLHNIGMQCISIAGDIWFGLGKPIFFGVLIWAVCQGYFKGDSAVTAVFDWVKPGLFVGATLLLGTGVIIGFYVPAYPAIIYTFGIFEWFVAVLEAMVAAQLVMLGLTHPEGHDILGEAKQALMLFLALFIQPVIMVIGLVASMILSYVSLRFLIYSFSGFMSDLFYVDHPLKDAASGSITRAANQAEANIMGTMAEGISPEGMIFSLLVFPFFMIMFATMVYYTVTFCYTVGTLLKTKTIRWIGAPGEQSQAAQLAEQTKGAASQAAGGFSKSMNKGAAQSDKKTKENNNEVSVDAAPPS